MWLRVVARGGARLSWAPGRPFVCPFFRAGQSEMQKEAAGAPGVVGQDAWDEGGCRRVDSDLDQVDAARRLASRRENRGLACRRLRARKREEGGQVQVPRHGAKGPNGCSPWSTHAESWASMRKQAGRARAPRIWTGPVGRAPEGPEIFPCVSCRMALVSARRGPNTHNRNESG